MTNIDIKENNLYRLDTRLLDVLQNYISKMQTF